MAQKKESSAVCAGRFLKNELKARNITQEDFAEMFGVSDRTLRRWIKGENITLDTIDYLSDFFKVDRRDIISYGDDVSVSSWGRFSR